LYFFFIGRALHLAAFKHCAVIFVLQDNRVLYISLHRHDDGMFYPMGEPKDYVDVGEGKGRGYSVNIPWNAAKIGDDAYRAAFAKIVMPIAYEFAPELVLISSGFDAAAGDPLGECFVS
ncbi:hypothetical protein ANCCAN_24029, partial [Ancylostoma caninum]